MSLDTVDIGLVAILAFLLIHNMRLSAKLDRLGRALRETLPAIEAFSDAVDRSEETVDRFARARSTAADPAPEPVARQAGLINRFYEIACQKGRT